MYNGNGENWLQDKLLKVFSLRVVFCLTLLLILRKGELIHRLNSSVLLVEMFFRNEELPCFFKQKSKPQLSSLYSQFP